MSPPPNTGSYRTKALIQALTETADALGQMVQTWDTVATVWGRRRQTTGGERANANQQKALADYVFETWHPQSLVTITASHRVLINGLPLGISRVENVGDRNETALLYLTDQALPAESP